MSQLLYHFFANDHNRLDELLEKATQDPQHLENKWYSEFRIGLLTHIKMEEKILFTTAQKNNITLPAITQLRLEHGAITTLMVAPPTPELIKVLRFILKQHNEVEEKEGGLYETCEALTMQQTQEILEQLRRTTPVPVQPFNRAPYVLDTIRRSLNRAGYDYDQILTYLT